MIEKKGWLKAAEARTNGFFIKGKKVKGANLTQAEVDAWNGVKAAPAPKVEEVVEAVVEETLVEIAEEEKPKTFFKKKKRTKK
jgi:hypothetical protein